MGMVKSLENRRAAYSSGIPSMKTVPSTTPTGGGEPFNDRQLFDADSIGM